MKCDPCFNNLIHAWKHDFPVQCDFSWSHLFFLRYDVAVFDLICVLLCVFGSVHLVVLVPDVWSIAVQLSLCAAGDFHCGALDWTLFIPVPILSRSSSTQRLLCEVREGIKTFQGELTLLYDLLWICKGSSCCPLMCSAKVRGGGVGSNLALSNYWMAKSRRKWKVSSDGGAAETWREGRLLLGLSCGKRAQKNILIKE